MPTRSCDPDRELVRLARGEAACRRQLGEVAAAFLAAKGHQRLGFACLSDYTRERLGMSARELQSLARVATALADLPRVAEGYATGALSWTKTRLLVRVARPETEAAWLARAQAHTTRALDALVQRHADPYAGAPADNYDPDADDPDDLIDGERPTRFRLACTPGLRRLWHDTVEVARRMAGEQGPPWQAAEAIAAEALSGAPRAADRDPPLSLRAQGRPGGERDRTRPPDGAADAAGRDPAPRSSGAEGVPPPAARLAAAPPDTRGLAQRIDPASGIMDDAPAHAPAPGTDDARGRAPGGDASDARPPDDPFALDARMAAILDELRGLECRIGHALQAAIARRVHRRLGFASVEAYVRDRLGISAGKARALRALERRLADAPALAAAYRQGTLSWLRTLLVLPVAREPHAEAWIARAGGVTVRRLEAEVAWALAALDADPDGATPHPPPPDAPLADLVAPDPAPPADGAPEDSHEPPPRHDHSEILDRAVGAGAPHAGDDGGAGALGASGGSDAVAGGAAAAGPPAVPAERQMRARRGTRGDGSQTPRIPFTLDAEITFVGPRSVVALLHGVLPAFQRPREPRWRAMARLLAHVRGEWQRQPRHRDPIFARDGWRCAVPACGGRRNLHDHHLHYRSRGGGNEQANRVTVCAWHHLRGIHAGRVRAAGTAPDGIAWELGIDRTGHARWRFRSDRYV